MAAAMTISVEMTMEKIVISDTTMITIAMTMIEIEIETGTAMVMISQGKETISMVITTILAMETTIIMIMIRDKRKTLLISSILIWAVLRNLPIKTIKEDQDRGHDHDLVIREGIAIRMGRELDQIHFRILTILIIRIIGDRRERLPPRLRCNPNAHTRSEVPTKLSKK